MQFSIITINYNNRDGLKRTIDSVVKQTCRDFEYIIIDGGSTDGGADVIRDANDNPDANITYYCSEKDNGLYNAMNKGIDKATGEYCIFMNSGDCFHDADVLKDIKEQGMETDVITGDIFFDTGLHCISEDHVSMAHFYNHTLYHQASFIRTSLLKANPYDENLKIAADWKFFFEEIALREKTYRHVHRDIAIFESGGVSADNHELIRKEMLGVLRQHFPQNVLDDYEIYTHGGDDYDRFFMTLKHSRLCNLIYRLDKAIVKTVLLLTGKKGY